MSELISLVASNKNLLYYDAEQDVTCSFNRLFQTTEVIYTQQKKVVFLYLDNSVNSVSAFWNFYKSNHALVLLGSAMKAGFKQSLEKLYQPYFIYDPNRSGIENYDSVTFNSTENIFRNKEDKAVKIDGNIKLLLSTSGTTGSPKLVKLSEKNIVSNAQSILKYLPINHKDVTPLNLPLHYSYGLSVLITNSIAGGKIVCTTKDILQKDFWNDFETHGYTSLAGVPYVYEILYRTGFVKKEFPSLKYLTQAGGKLSEMLAKVFTDYSSKKHIRFFIMYGQTEATARMSWLGPAYLGEKKLSIGMPIQGGRFEIDKETSELLYYGENVFGGYANSLEDLETYSQAQPLRTGDVAMVDDDGFYFITGRLKRMVKLFGHRMNLDEIEQSLNETFSQSSFICTGIEDKTLLVGVKASVVDEKDITQFLYSRFSIHPGVISIKQVDDIPLTENRKINYTKFIEQHGD